MIEKVNWLINKKGGRLFTIEWLCDMEKENAIIYIAHGFGEHMLAGYRESLAEVLCQKGYTVCGQDYRGHGRSDGKKGYISSLNDLTEDALLQISIILSKYTYKLPPLILYGYSFGASIVCECAHILGPGIVKGVVLESPAMAYSPKLLNPCHLIIGTIMAYLCPCMTLTKFDPDPTDPLRVLELRADSANVLFSSMTKAAKTLQERVFCPVFTAHGAMDCWVPLEKIVEILDGIVTSKSVKLRIFENSGHTIRYDNDFDMQSFKEELCKWLEDILL